jgi:hypothetical protein
MKVVNEQTIDLEIKQFLIQTGCDRDFAVKKVSEWFQSLARAKSIALYSVVSVINHVNRFSVTYRLSGSTTAITAIYETLQSTSSSSYVATPAANPSAPVSPPTSVEETAVPQEQKSDTEDAWDRAMRGI